MEIQKLLREHGATGFAQAWDEAEGLAIFQCRINNRMIKFEVRTPNEKDFVKTEKGKIRSAEVVKTLADAELRRRWRARLLITKAKLEMIADGDTDFDSEFMADIMLPDGKTMGRWFKPQIESVYLSGQIPRMIAAMPEPKVRKKL
jgi:hypothetical protein